MTPREGNEDIYAHDLGCPSDLEVRYPSCLNCPLPICQLEKPLKKGRPKSKTKKVKDE